MGFVTSLTKDENGNPIIITAETTEKNDNITFLPRFYTQEESEKYYQTLHEMMQQELKTDLENDVELRAAFQKEAEKAADILAQIMDTPDVDEIQESLQEFFGLEG